MQRAPAFDLLGRVAVNYDGRAFSYGVRWTHERAGDEIWLLTPVGQTIAHIAATPSGATLTGADRKQIEADDVESLTRRGLGWELPLSRLAWWVRGEIVPVWFQCISKHVQFRRRGGHQSLPEVINLGTIDR